MSRQWQWCVPRSIRKHTIDMRAWVAGGKADGWIWCVQAPDRTKRGKWAGTSQLDFGIGTMMLVVHAWGIHPFRRQLKPGTFKRRRTELIPSSRAETLPWWVHVVVPLRLKVHCPLHLLVAMHPPVRVSGVPPKEEGILNICWKTVRFRLCRSDIYEGLGLNSWATVKSSGGVLFYNVVD